MAAFLVHAVSQIFSHLQQTNGSTYKGTALFLNYRRSAVGGNLKIHFNHFAEKPIFKRFHRKTLCVLTHTHTHTEAQNALTLNGGDLCRLRFISVKQC